MNSGRRRPRGWVKPLIGGGAILMLATMVGTAVVALAGSSSPTYSQATPDDVLQTAVAMVKNGNARHLGDLVYADSPEMRGTLTHLGILLDHLQGLGTAIKKAFPEEVEKLRADAEKEAAGGGAASLLNALTQGRGGQRRGGGDRGGEDQEEVMRATLERLFSDPYGWIEQNQGRLSTMKVTDDAATVLVDSTPAAGVGIPMRLDQGKWYFALPTSTPPLSQVMPRAPEQWKMLNSLIKILDNTVVELSADVKQGRLRNLRSIGDRAQEKVLLPGGLWFAAYSADLDARRRVDGAVRRFKQRKEAWEASRESAAAPDAPRPVVPAALSRAIDKVAAKEIEALARARNFDKPADLSDGEFETMVSGWLAKNGLDVRLGGPLDGGGVARAVQEFETKEARRLAASKRK
jgi:hypothetical protein